jgi:3-oxoacyl-[acyl-carrier-protein] synthase III
MNKYGVSILGTGSYLPEKVLTNADLEKMVQTNDEWIVTRTGIKERRIADEKTATSDLAVKAAQRALDEAGLKAEDLDLIIVATITPDMMFPSTACFVQKALKVSGAPCFDLAAACSGFIYGLSIAQNFIRTGTYSRVLIIGADTLSKITDWSDRNSCVLFGDGAGAIILGRSETDDQLLSVYLGADGSYDELLFMPGGGSRNPTTAKTVEDKMHFIKLAGKETFRVAVTKMSEAARKALELAGKQASDLALFIPHQANKRIIDAVAKQLDFPTEKVCVNIDRYANVSAATTIIALDEARKQNKLKKGDLVELVAFGGGFTWASAVLRI